MGTRSVTHVYDTEGNMIITMYRQYDGYLSGMGRDLETFLKPIVVVNGIMLGDSRKIANGMHCLAAQLVAHFKTEPGGIYLYPPNEDIDAGQDYEYFIRIDDDDNLIFEAKDYTGTLYDGPVADFDAMKVEEAQE